MKKSALSSREAGFTILELVIASTVLLVVLLLAGQILVESRRMMHRSALNRTDRAPESALTLLRRDIHAARAIDGAAPIVFTSETLTLVLPQSVIAYRLAIGKTEEVEDLEEMRRGCLYRTVWNEKGELVGRRCALAGVSSFRWRQLGSNLVEVEAKRLLEHSTPGTQLMADNRFFKDGLQEDDFRMIAALRGGRNGASW